MSTAFWVLRGAMALLWLVSAVLPVLPSGQERSLSELMRFDFQPEVLMPLMYLAMLLDVLCAYLALCVPRAWAWLLQIILVLAYSVLLSIGHAELWCDPFGVLLKNIPIMAAMGVMIAHDSGKFKGEC
ncbi:hypothetical protein DTO96_102208 [Ephemeroptericola cinctiostellae]|uniref:Uncharacterized protein n=1 Tax=Ephemeroptericola cinctiostellae TaxID=2268024 RepID=A0A345DDL6_9BURK|nr:DoxX-like family protein [Ephemeroptericola cinctiostellae]AXF86454.1 hypothetical protein DTO96_102208 [Ephemeroptericola cinctiostellae]